MLIGINGISRSGKDTLADMLVPFKSQKVACADEMKRICMRVYPQMTEDHLWGPSEKRNEPIKAYPRKHIFKDEPPTNGPWTCLCCGVKIEEADEKKCFLTARYALQLLGTEWGRHCYTDTWIDIVLAAYKDLMLGCFFYSGPRGLLLTEVQTGIKMVAIPDLRYKNEMAAVRKAGGQLWRIKRAGAGLKGGMGQHTSETEQLEVPDSYFDLVFENNSSVEALQMHVEYVMKDLKGLHV